MKYKYKESIKNAVTEMYSASFVDEENRKNELDEVYRKAEAFDKIVDAHQNVLKDVRIRGAKLPADFDKFTLLSERIINKYAEFDKGDKDLSKADFDAVYKEDSQ